MFVIKNLDTTVSQAKKQYQQREQE